MALPFAVPPDLFPVEHRFLELDGARIHYIDEGSGKTLLLLYGNPSWSFPYRKMISGLKEGFRCVALDFPGHGMSDAPSATASRHMSTAQCSSDSSIASA